MPGPKPGQVRRYGVLSFSIEECGLSPLRSMVSIRSDVELMRCAPQPRSQRFQVQMVVLAHGLATIMESIERFAVRRGFSLRDMSCSGGELH
ncbi:MAG: hypothetical protein EKK46_06455 [Rhodocyclaceae bacterium]|nr:MAG: hypothetical protein EKK46_06455 [Rhodocyclaceae bacterium]